MKRYKRKPRSHGDVELNMAAMLDMAFQLLAFFILTFRPSPVEAQISLRMPKPIPLVGGGSVEMKEPTDEPKPELIPIAIYATAEGEIARITLGSRNLAAGTIEQTLAAFNQTLGEMLSGAPFDGAALQASPDLRYERLMQVVDVCTRQKLANGEPLTNVSFSEMAGGP
jgi:biopolymer transport protein ExbD